MADSTTTTSSPAPAPSSSTTTASPAPAPTSSTTTTSSPAPAPSSSTTTTSSPAPAPAPTGTVPANTESDQAELDRLAAAVQGLSEYDKQEIYGQAVEDRYGAFSPRKQAQDTREAYVAASLGDPTRDPVAKQKAMDLTVVQPGAVADAQAVANAGTSSNQAQANASHTA